MTVNWDEQKEWNEAVEASPAIVQEALEADRIRWNDLLFELARIANYGDPDGPWYHGETSEELLTKIRDRFSLNRDGSPK